MKKIALRTDESRFVDLPDYPFAPHYLYVHHPGYAPLRMHFIDEGGDEPLTVLLLHGCPTWSFLYRKVISALRATDNASFRIIAPDFIGCGKSDKLLQRSDYSYDFYVDTLKQFIEQLDLKRILLRNGQPGNTTRTIEYLVKGSGEITVAYSSVKGGSARKSIALQ